MEMEAASMARESWVSIRIRQKDGNKKIKEVNNGNLLPCDLMPTSATKGKNEVISYACT